MITHIRKIQSTFAYKLFSAVLAYAFIFSSVVLPQAAQAQSVPMPLLGGLNLPAPGSMVGVSPVFDGPMIKGITLYPEHPLKFDFIIDQGDDQLSAAEKKLEYKKLANYFLASMTVPENDLWVNLSPHEADRIIPDKFGQTEMGRDLLAQDYILKQLTASLIYPEDELGKKFWDKVYKKIHAQYGHTNVPTNMFNKVWIVPEKAVVFEQGQTAYVAESKLRVMLEADYEAMEAQQADTASSRASARDKSFEQNTPKQNLISNQIVRSIIIPEIEREVNVGKNFRQLRQIYNSLILAAWYKQKFKQSLLAQIYADQNKVSGVDNIDRSDKQRIYDQYLKAFEQGVFNYIKEDIEPGTEEIIPRKYFSGGAGLQLSSTGILMSSANFSSLSLSAQNNLASISSSPIDITEVDLREYEEDSSSSPVDPGSQKIGEFDFNGNLRQFLIDDILPGINLTVRRLSGVIDVEPIKAEEIPDEFVEILEENFSRLKSRDQWLIANAVNYSVDVYLGMQMINGTPSDMLTRVGFILGEFQRVLPDMLAVQSASSPVEQDTWRVRPSLWKRESHLPHELMQRFLKRVLELPDIDFNQKVKEVRIALKNILGLDKIKIIRFPQHEGLNVHVVDLGSQPTGSFKPWIGYGILQSEARDNIVVSTGNQGKAVPWIVNKKHEQDGRSASVTIFVNDKIPQEKLDTLREIEARSTDQVHIEIVGDPALETVNFENYDAALQGAMEYMDAMGKEVYFVNHADKDAVLSYIALGDAILDQHIEQGIDLNKTAIIVPVGAGGLASGVVIAARLRNPNIKVVLVQTQRTRHAYKSFLDGMLRAYVDAQDSEYREDGIDTKKLEPVAYEVLSNLADGLVLVDSKRIPEKIAYYYDRGVRAEGAAVLSYLAMERIASGLKDRGVEHVINIATGSNISDEDIDEAITIDQNEKDGTPPVVASSPVSDSGNFDMQGSQPLNPDELTNALGFQGVEKLHFGNWPLWLYSVMEHLVSINEDAKLREAIQLGLVRVGEAPQALVGGEGFYYLEDGSYLVVTNHESMDPGDILLQALYPHLAGRLSPLDMTDTIHPYEASANAPWNVNNIAYDLKRIDYDALNEDSVVMELSPATGVVSRLFLDELRKRKIKIKKLVFVEVDFAYWKAALNTAMKDIYGQYTDVVEEIEYRVLPIINKEIMMGSVALPELTGKVDLLMWENAAHLVGDQLLPILQSNRKLLKDGGQFILGSGSFTREGLSPSDVHIDTPFEFVWDEIVELVETDPSLGEFKAIWDDVTEEERMETWRKAFEIQIFPKKPPLSQLEEALIKSGFDLKTETPRLAIDKDGYGFFVLDSQGITEPATAPFFTISEQKKSLKRILRKAGEDGTLKEKILRIENRIEALSEIEDLDRKLNDLRHRAYDNVWIKRGQLYVAWTSIHAIASGAQLEPTGNVSSPLGQEERSKAEISRMAEEKWQQATYRLGPDSKKFIHEILVKRNVQRNHDGIYIIDGDRKETISIQDALALINGKVQNYRMWVVPMTLEQLNLPPAQRFQDLVFVVGSEDVIERRTSSSPLSEGRFTPDQERWILAMVAMMEGANRAAISILRDTSQSPALKPETLRRYLKARRDFLIADAEFRVFDHFHAFKNSTYHKAEIELMHEFNSSDEDIWNRYFWGNPPLDISMRYDEDAISAFKTVLDRGDEYWHYADDGKNVMVLNPGDVWIIDLESVSTKEVTLKGIEGIDRFYVSRNLKGENYITTVGGRSISMVINGFYNAADSPQYHSARFIVHRAANNNIWVMNMGDELMMASSEDVLPRSERIIRDNFMALRSAHDRQIEATKNGLFGKEYFRVHPITGKLIVLTDMIEREAADVILNRGVLRANNGRRSFLLQHRNVQIALDQFSRWIMETVKGIEGESRIIGFDAETIDKMFVLDLRMLLEAVKKSGKHQNIGKKILEHYYGGDNPRLPLIASFDIERAEEIHYFIGQDMAAEFGYIWQWQSFGKTLPRGYNVPIDEGKPDQISLGLTDRKRGGESASSPVSGRDAKPTILFSEQKIVIDASDVPSREEAIWAVIEKHEEENDDDLAFEDVTQEQMHGVAYRNLAYKAVEAFKSFLNGVIENHPEMDPLSLALEGDYYLHLAELIDNAADSLRQRYGADYWKAEITFRALKGEKFIEIQILDNGIGLEVESNKDVVSLGGRGVGFSNAKNSFLEANVDVKLQNRENQQGAYILLRFPSQMESIEESFLPEGRGIVLVVDDYASLRRGLSLILKTEGFTVITAENGAEAWKIIQERGDEIAWVLTDYNMPEMNGEELVQRMKEEFPKIDVTMHSANDPYNMKEIAQRIGKPIYSKTDALETIRAYVERDDKKKGASSPISVFEKTVIVVDQHQATRQTLKEILKEEGFQHVFTTGNTKSALKLIENSIASGDEIAFVIAEQMAPVDGSARLSSYNAVQAAHDNIPLFPSDVRIYDLIKELKEEVQVSSPVQETPSMVYQWTEINPELNGYTIEDLGPASSRQDLISVKMSAPDLFVTRNIRQTRLDRIVGSLNEAAAEDREVFRTMFIHEMYRLTSTGEDAASSPVISKTESIAEIAQILDTFIEQNNTQIDLTFTASNESQYDWILMYTGTPQRPEAVMLVRAPTSFDPFMKIQGIEVSKIALASKIVESDQRLKYGRALVSKFVEQYGDAFDIEITPIYVGTRDIKEGQAEWEEDLISEGFDMYDTLWGSYRREATGYIAASSPAKEESEEITALSKKLSEQFNGPSSHGIRSELFVDLARAYLKQKRFALAKSWAQRALDTASMPEHDSMPIQGILKAKEIIAKADKALKKASKKSSSEAADASSPVGSSKLEEHRLEPFQRASMHLEHGKRGALTLKFDEENNSDEVTFSLERQPSGLVAVTIISDNRFESRIKLWHVQPGQVKKFGDIDGKFKVNVKNISDDTIEIQNTTPKAIKTSLLMRRSAMFGSTTASSPIENPGGIDLTPNRLNLQIKRDGNGVPLPVNLQPLKAIQIEGLIPVIINITPIYGLPMLSKVVNEHQPTRHSGHEQDHPPSPVAYLGQRRLNLN